MLLNIEINRMNIIQLVCAGLLYNLPCVHQVLITPWILPSMRYVDIIDVQVDLFFDRIVFITLDIPNFLGDKRPNKNIATGVLINDNTVLTSYNPFRNLTKSAEVVSKIYVCYITHRRVANPYNTAYAYACATIACGRQVIPLPDDSISDDKWHGADKKHTPLHDLMVLKLDDNLEIWTPEKEYTYEERHSEVNRKEGTIQIAGPQVTNIAIANDIITMPIKFVSLGLKSELDVKHNHVLQTAEYDDNDKVMVDCEDWLPKDWGYFICLWNDPDFKGFASGALLFSNKILYGVGSFTLWRGEDSVIVFTDVRPYTELIRNTCTKADFE